MKTVKEAIEIIKCSKIETYTETVATKHSLGRVLQEDVYADRNVPPYDRVSMDGIAISFLDWERGMNNFPTASVQYAGDPSQKLKRETCIEVMTGSVLPKNADVVIRYEDVSMADGEMRVDDIEVKKWMNVHKEGNDARKGKLLLNSGKKINSGDIGTILSQGKTIIKVKKVPKVALISTGSELVEPDQIPQSYQIRKSNIYLLEAILQANTIETQCFHIPDEKLKMEMMLSSILQDFKIVLLTGGVSKGKKDFIPEVLEKLGVEKKIHGITQRPGKPFWFGQKQGVVVFGFPGNPVSSFVCFEYYFKSWMNAYLELEQPLEMVEIAEEITFTKSLTYFLPALVENKNARLLAIPFKGKGSGDYLNLSKINAFLILDEEKSFFSKGEKVPFIKIE